MDRSVGVSAGGGELGLLAGCSGVQALGLLVEREEAAVRWGRAAARRKGRSGGVLVTKG